jgi:hypothetical protein
MMTQTFSAIWKIFFGIISEIYNEILKFFLIKYRLGLFWYVEYYEYIGIFFFVFKLCTLYVLEAIQGKLVTNNSSVAMINER